MAKRARRARRSSYSFPPGRGRCTRGRRRTVAALLIVMGFLASGAAGAGAYFLPVVTAALGATGQSGVVHDDPAPVSPAAPAPAARGAFTVLLLGSDDDAKFDAGHLLTQSMILVRVVPQTRRVTMLSIPRDLFVPISGGGRAKIDTAFYGGPAGAVRTVEQNFQVHVDHYVWVGLRGLVNLIDRLGGVEVITTNPVVDDFYPADLAGGDPYAYTRVAVMPGAQHMNGLQAMEYVRSRHGDLREDFGRSERQQQVLLALRAAAHHLGLADLPSLASAVGGELRTDMALPQVAGLLPLVAALSVDGVQRILLLPPYTHSAMVGDQDAVLPDWSLIRPLVAQTFP